MDYPSPFRSATHIGEIDVFPADRQRCPVCGHPTGDCTGPVKYDVDMSIPKKIVGTDPLVLVEEDVTEERAITPFTKARVIIHRKGDYITTTQARSLGLME